MLSLKDNCLAPNSNYPYVKRIQGGKDNSPEGLQVGARASVCFALLTLADIELSPNPRTA
jgi:hypothetical protein